MERLLRIVFVSLCVVVALLWAPPHARAQQPQQPPQDAKKADEFKMITYQAVFLSKGPKWVDGGEPDETATAHRSYVRELLTSGRAVIAGLLDGSASRLVAMYILTGTPEEAKQIADADPGVKAERATVEILKWMGPAGWFQKVTDLQPETLFFGFLVNGPNRGQDAETAKQMQRAHLDYMDGQAKLGKLVLAGPLLDGGTRRGLIAYRVPTLAEAVERASADPMVKAGRLAVEMYQWRVPKGILK